ncbi:hypothetical protein JW960_00970 [candidate division KSB1 bacterium]|nr:hypothetical protein [candidate division KSB1 bacterium]
MYIAIAAYQNRIASLLDSAENLIMLDSPDYCLSNASQIDICGKSNNEIVQLLAEQNIKILICGAIHDCVWQQIEARHIKVIPWVTGNIQNVVQAFITDTLASSAFLMPGRFGKNRNRRRGFRRGRNENF